LGGDPKLLIDKINSLNLAENLMKYKGILVGYSAGAMVLSKKILIPGGGDSNYPNSISYSGLGIAPFSVIPHYNRELKEKVLDFLADNEVYGISNSSAIFFDPLTKDLTEMGGIYKL
jgi:peptidase E